MKLVRWYVRGLNLATKQEATKSFILKNNVFLVSFLEHKIKKDDENRVFGGMGVECPMFE